MIESISKILCFFNHQLLLKLSFYLFMQIFSFFHFGVHSVTLKCNICTVYMRLQVVIFYSSTNLKYQYDLCFHCAKEKIQNRWGRTHFQVCFLLNIFAFLPYYLLPSVYSLCRLLLYF